MAEEGKVRVAVVFGGRSSEHSISCVTAGSVMAAMDPNTYEVLPVGITKEGSWVLASADPQRLAITDGRLPSVEPAGAALALPSDPGTRSLVVMEPGRVPRELGEVDVVLPLLHGPYGEDGTIQGMLELAGVPYVGAGVLASAASMDKAYAKLLFAGNGLPVGPYVVVRDRDWRRERKRVLDEVKDLGWPVFVKPARSGSSIGIGKVYDESALEAAVEAARRHDPKVIVEATVVGREIECAVLEGLDDGPPEASVPGEVRVRADHEFYDFEAKYIEGSDVEIPAALPEPVTAEVRRLAVAAFGAVSCEGLARVDFFYTDDGRVVLNEINTMPGFTPASAFPRMWAASGLDYPALVDRLIRTALRRPLGLR